jgi:hypothetical protein
MEGEVMDKIYCEAWGVACLTDMGWFGRSRPARYTEADAKKRATQLNADPEEKDTWEARPLSVGCLGGAVVSAATSADENNSGKGLSVSRGW